MKLTVTSAQNSPGSGLFQTLSLHTLSSPLGTLQLVTDARDRVCALDFEEATPHLQQTLRRYYGDCELVAAQKKSEAEARLQQYFSGDWGAVRHIVVADHGSPFQRQLWAALREIPAGQVMSYGELARQLGQPHAARKVGGANAANPIAIIVPCHRVIGSDGQLKGYAWGLARKQWLLAHEQARLRRPVCDDACSRSQMAAIG